MEKRGWMQEARLRLIKLLCLLSSLVLHWEHLNQDSNSPALLLWAVACQEGMDGLNVENCGRDDAKQKRNIPFKCIWWKLM